MITEWILENTEKNRRVYCETRAQAAEKCKFLYPDTYPLIYIKQGRTFKDFDDFIENRNYHKTSKT